MKRDTLLSLLDTCFSVRGALALLSAVALAVNPNKVPFAAIAGCALSGLVLFALGKIVEQIRWRVARREGLGRVANRLGMTYRPSSDWNVLGWSPSFYLTHVRWNRKSLNVLEGSLDVDSRYALSSDLMAQWRNRAKVLKVGRCCLHAD